MREQRGRNVEVILNQISLRHTELRPEEFIEIGETYNLITDPDFEIPLVFWELY